MWPGWGEGAGTSSQMNGEIIMPAAFPGSTEVLPRGATIGRYVVLGLVGRGGMGDVYAAYDPELDRKVAVKLVRLRREGSLDASQGRARLMREAQAIAKLSHPNVVVVYDVGAFNDTMFIAMEFVDGGTVGYWLQSGLRTWHEVLAVYQAAGRGLAAAHRAGMVHRDFKPDNVMVTQDGEVRVMDFGLARPFVDSRDATAASRWVARTAAAAAAGIDPESTMPLALAAATQADGNSGPRLVETKLTETGLMLGTPAYMAPEQFAGKATDARADQFSFCVALYESLYGQRPFPGKTVAELMTSVVAGTVREPPADAKVPAWLRRVILRGLQRNPEARYPTMEALLEELTHDPARTRRRWLAVAGAAITLGAATASSSMAWRASHVGPTLCATGAQRLNGVWEGAETRLSARKLAIHRAFAATHLPYAETAFNGVHQLLDRYVGAWTAMYADACHATHSRGEQSAEVLDLRMSCLSERLGRVKALTDLYEQANPTTVENAVLAASSLPSLDRCADIKLLRAVIPPPDSPAVRAQVEVLRGDLAHVKELGDSGQCATATMAGQRLIGDARAVGYLPLEAESLNAVARFGPECMSTGDSIQMHRQAVLAATASRDVENTVQAMTFFAYTLADRTPDIAQARIWIDLAEATLKGMGRPAPALESIRLETLGRIMSKEGTPEEALLTFKRAQTLMESTIGQESPDVAQVINNIGLVLQEMNRFDEALLHFQRSAALMAKVLGPDHPMLVLVLGNQGEALNALRRFPEAQAALERALEIARRAGSSPFYTAWLQTRLGETLLGDGRPREARAPLEEALRLAPNEQIPYLPAARFALARALWDSPETRPRSFQLAQQAKAATANAGPVMAEVSAWLRAHPGR
jgi:eukaryotic-like serine/threonine-protein kinase